MLTEFNFHAPSFVVAGRNSVHQTGELLNQWGAGKNIMVVCGNCLLYTSPSPRDRG